MCKREKNAGYLQNAGTSISSYASTLYDTILTLTTLKIKTFENIAGN